MSTAFIDDAEELAEFCESLETEVLAVDTESDHYHAYSAQVCLIQVATPQKSALIDPLALSKEELAPFFSLLKEPTILKLFHSAQNDIVELDRDYQVSVVNLFDTQVAARILGYERSSLSWLSEELLGVCCKENFQRFDWTRRPLPERARDYAVRDVIHLFDLWERFDDELAQSGWGEFFDQYCEYITEHTRHEPRPFDEEQWRRIKGVTKLDGEGRAAAKALYLWRHEACLESNRAAFLVLSNGALYNLARQRPQSVAELSRVKGMPKRFDEEWAEEIVAVLRKSASMEPPPARPPRREQPTPNPAQEARFAALKDWRNDQADKLDVPSEFIATNSTLADIASNPPEKVSELERFVDLLPWHRQTFGKEIVELVRGRS